MVDQFLAEIRMFPFNFPPQGWAFCDGQLLPLSQNTALFSLLGTTYGGNGASNFALPNLQGSTPIHYGQGPGLSNYSLGDSVGSTTVTLLASEMPTHSHILRGVSGLAERSNPNNTAYATADGENLYTQTATNLTPMHPNTITFFGGNTPHTNMMPYLVVNFCIAMQGIFPPRT
ncbi:MAG: tail fiber protein [Anaerolineae bacterium]|jgi:microcystin-dependent protein|nr:tail fiber protein [Anaerolineae bacterium]